VVLIALIRPRHWVWPMCLFGKVYQADLSVVRAFGIESLLADRHEPTGWAVGRLIRLYDCYISVEDSGNDKT